MFKEGKFYVIRARDRNGDWAYCDATLDATRDARNRLRAIAKKAGRYSGNYSSDPYEDLVDGDDQKVRVSYNPFEANLYPLDTEFKDLTAYMRCVRKGCGVLGMDSNSVCLAIVDTSIQAYIPEAQSEAEIALRQFALEKLTADERELLKVTHWEVYHKLSDRSMFPPEDED